MFAAPGSFHLLRLAVGGVALGLFVAACGEPPGAMASPSELATVEVTAAPDAALSTGEDGQERRVSSALAGALPDGFPADVPVFRPASLVDQTIVPGGVSVLVFETPAPRAAVASSFTSRLRAHGWRSAEGGVWTKAGRRLKLTVEARPNGAIFRLEL